MLSEEERAARQRRLRIIAVVAVAFVAVGVAFGFYVDHRASEEQSDLRRRLAQAARNLDHEELLADWYDFRANPRAIDALDQFPTEDRIAVRGEGETVIAIYKAGFAGRDRCFDLRVAADGTEVDERSC